MSIVTNCLLWVYWTVLLAAAIVTLPFVLFWTALDADARRC